MHAVVAAVRVNDGEAATRHLRENIVPQVSQAPGFVAGYWVRLEGADEGRAVMVFESEDAARQVAENLTPAPDDATTLERVDVGEVVESA